MIVASYLDVTRQGFYVDVGCHHPLRGSNTLRLYSRGWHGLVVDGNPELISLFQRMRPRDLAVCAVVSNEERSMTFTISRQAELSTVSREFEKTWMRTSDVKERVHVNAVRLQTLLDQNHVPARFELLSIDVEGHDYEVLTSFDIDGFRPRVIIVEMHGFQLGRDNSHAVYEYLEQHDYRLMSYSVMNGIFLDVRPGDTLLDGKDRKSNTTNG